QWARTHALPIRGVLTASVQGRGTLKAPQLEATAQVPELRVRQETLRELKLQATVADQRAQVNITSSVTGAFVQARGTVALKPDYYMTATLDTRDVSLETLLAGYFPEAVKGLHSRLALHADAKGPLKDPALMEAHIEIPTFEAAHKSLQIAATAPIRMD